MKTGMKTGMEMEMEMETDKKIRGAGCASRTGEFGEGVGLITTEPHGR